MAEDDGRPFGTTRSYWLQRHSMLAVRFNQLLMEKGDPELMAAVRESKNLLEQMYAEEVRKDSQTVQYLLGRYRVVCARMAQAAITDVPGGKGLLDEVKTCEKVLMIPNTSVTEMENPYLRPDHEVDLSVLPPSSYHFEALQGDQYQSEGQDETMAESGQGHDQYHEAQTQGPEYGHWLPWGSEMSD